MDLHIKDVLKNLVNDSSLSSGFHGSKIEQFWSKRMPQSITDRTTSIKLRGKNLHLHISSAALKNELFNSKAKIIEMLNEHLDGDYISDVVFH